MSSSFGRPVWPLKSRQLDRSDTKGDSRGRWWVNRVLTRRPLRPSPSHWSRKTLFRLKTANSPPRSLRTPPASLPRSSFGEGRDKTQPSPDFSMLRVGATQQRGLLKIPHLFTQLAALLTARLLARRSIVFSQTLDVVCVKLDSFLGESDHFSRDQSRSTRFV